MTRYEQGFMAKCAESGMTKAQALQLFKQAQFFQGLGNIAKGGLKAVGSQLLYGPDQDDMLPSNINAGVERARDPVSAGLDQARLGVRQVAQGAKSGVRRAGSAIANMFRPRPSAAVQQPQQQPKPQRPQQYAAPATAVAVR